MPALYAAGSRVDAPEADLLPQKGSAGAAACRYLTVPTM